jgi:hypothetical protein
MTIWLALLLGAIGCYKSRAPKRVTRYQPREVPVHLRRPSPWTPDLQESAIRVAALRAYAARLEQAAGIAPATPRPAIGPPTEAIAHPPAPLVVPAPTAPPLEIITVSTQVRLSTLAALRRLGFSRKDAQGQLDTNLGLAIQRSLAKG